MTDCTTFTSDVLTIERSGHIATLWLDRPEARNAMGTAFFADLPGAVAALDADDEVRVIVVAARGPHFSVGLDLKQMSLSGGGSGTSQATKASRFRVTLKEMQAGITALANSEKATIAIVHGYCIGGGVDLITACDLRYASADAIFSVRETKIAIVADLGSLQRLPAIIGQGFVNELALTGRDVTAARAASMGLVNEVGATEAEATTIAMGVAAEIAANSPLVVAGTKAVLAAGEYQTVEQGLDFVGVWNAGFLASADLGEAMTAFIEKRPPNFTGN